MCRPIGNTLRLTIVLGCCLAFIFQSINNKNCEFVYKVDEETDDYVDNGTLNFGLFYEGYNGYCFDNTQGYIAIDDDANVVLSIARDAHIVSMTAGGIATFLVAIDWLACKVPCGTILEGLAFFVAWVSGLIVYAVFGMEGCGTDFIATELLNDVDAAAAEYKNQLDAATTDFTSVGTYPGMDATELGADLGLNLNMTGVNITESLLEKGFPIEIAQKIPFGTKCNWGPGASFNLMAVLIYFVSGALLCCLPDPTPVCEGRKESEQERKSTNLSRSAGRNVV